VTIARNKEIYSNFSNATWPVTQASGYPFPAANYVFNYNLIEQPEGIIKGAANLMMVREFYKTTIAVLRPTNYSTGSSTNRPQYALNNGDSSATASENNNPSIWKAHGNGSHILFADRHVKLFGLTFFTKYIEMTAANSWDPETDQWYSFAPGSDKGTAYITSIAIMPYYLSPDIERRFRHPISMTPSTNMYTLVYPVCWLQNNSIPRSPFCLQTSIQHADLL
jgi:hypothetical protein